MFFLVLTWSTWHDHAPKNSSEGIKKHFGNSGLRGAMAFALALQSVHDLPEGHGQTIFTANHCNCCPNSLVDWRFKTGTMLEVLRLLVKAMMTQCSKSSTRQLHHSLHWIEITSLHSLTSQNGEDDDGFDEPLPSARRGSALMPPS
ncbi:hypothetical protein MLD38_019465 [Melastoma candidum]|uniref:Uncharacterized protein n=1 Tax=Melastoma candidum TaxID=119954 RepID=A0ACB9QWI1_9MYRT|nr:hypothetical protein MLD38_019465 [Melastoma candidum]